MTILKKSQATTTTRPNQIRELNPADLQVVSGGLNPQPLPPRIMKL